MVAKGAEREGASREILYLDVGPNEPGPRRHEIEYPSFVYYADARWGILYIKSEAPGEEPAREHQGERNRTIFRDAAGQIVGIRFFDPRESGVSIGGLPADPNLPTTPELQGFFALHEIRLAK